jgi:rhodanese-related sulfurtransferase
MSNKLSNPVDAATVRSWLENHEPVTVVDVRTPAEFEAAHIRGSYNVPLPLLNEHAEELSRRLDEHVVLVCQSGVRSSQARDRLAAYGLENAQVVNGGVPDYEAAGGDVVHGRQRWAMERQVRMIAGSLVTGSIATSLFAPKARFLAGAVGAGLTIAALTDTCAMSRLLSKLPYNRGTDEPTRESVLTQISESKAA